MANRKIAECINVRINIGNYQHIELTKYAEEEVEFSSEKELVNKEDELRDSLLASLIRSMKVIPERLGKGVESAVEVEASIKKAIPAWLENNPVPNIANGAKKSDIKNSAEQMANKSSKQGDSVDRNSIIESVVEPEKQILKDDAQNLFEDDNAPSRPIEEDKGIKEDLLPKELQDAKTGKVDKSSDKSDKSDKSDDFDLFGDSDDIFDEK